MTEQQLLLANIIKNPDGDTERLVYADYIEEQGQRELSEFIRIQVEYNLLADSDPKQFFVSDLERMRCVKQRCKELWDTAMWRVFDAPWGAADGERFRWCHRGFWDRISCTAEDFLKHADALIWHDGATDKCQMCKGNGCGEPTYEPPQRKDCSACGYSPLQMRPSGGNPNYERWCPRCWVVVSGRHTGWESCSGCRGTGRVPRPCPLTAHPIRKVVLTTRPGHQDPSNPLAWILPAEWTGQDYGETCVEHNWHLDQVFKERWPGIEFVLPEQTVDVGTDDAIVSMQAGAPIQAGQMITTDAQGRAIPVRPNEGPSQIIGFALENSK